jgi:hypothetical protein
MSSPLFFLRCNTRVNAISILKTSQGTIMEKWFEKLFDPYERKARMFPGLLVIIPILIPLLGTYGARNVFFTSVMGLLGTGGAIYALANIARGLGKRLEEKLIQTWGGMPTTIMLRHRDNFLDRVTKQRIHGLVEHKLGIPIPTLEQEQADPVWADGAYKGASRRIIELTRNDKQLLLKENIAYGFHRNMLALKPVGILVCLLSILYALFLAEVIHVPLKFVLVNIFAPGITAGITLLASVLFLSVWLLYFNEASVRRIGYVYAERLFECINTIPKQKVLNSSASEGN